MERYRELASTHLTSPTKRELSPNSVLMAVETTQSQIPVALAARTTAWRDGEPAPSTCRVVDEEFEVGHEIFTDLAAGQSLSVEKVVTLVTGRDVATSEPAAGAERRLGRQGRFAELRDAHTLAWAHLWERLSIEFDDHADELRILRLHLLHLLQTVSCNSEDLDIGVPARGLHGEAYRGHIFWDELFIFPVLNLRLPTITRSLLRYRYRRLVEARQQLVVFFFAFFFFLCAWFSYVLFNTLGGSAAAISRRPIRKRSSRSAVTIANLSPAPTRCRVRSRSRFARRWASAASRCWCCPAMSRCGPLRCTSAEGRRAASARAGRDAVADSLNRLAALLNGESRVTILCGSGCEGAHDELLALGERLKAPMVHALRGKEHVEWENPYDVGMTGLIGFSSGYYAMRDCDALLMLGTDFPYRQFYPNGGEVRIAQVDLRPENIGRRAAVDLGVVGDVRATIAALLPLLDERRDGSRLAERSSTTPRPARRSTTSLSARPEGAPFIPSRSPGQSAIRQARIVFTCDVGLPTVWAARYLAMNGKRRLFGSFWHGSMANAMAQAIGAQASFPGRRWISLSGDGGSPC